MKSVEKRDKLVKEIIKPMMKEEGYKGFRNTWYSQREDCYVVVHMQNSMWNSEITGICFWFNIDVLPQSEIDDMKQVKEWINSFSMLHESKFLPKCGLLHEYRYFMSGYQIDGYRNCVPLDMDYENIAVQIKKDFQLYILPQLQKIHTIKDWDQLREELLMSACTKEVLLLRYYTIANMLACSDCNILELKKYQEEANLTVDEIKENIGLLKEVQRYAETVCENAEEYIMKTLEE